MNTKSENPGPIVINNNRLGDMAEQWVKLLAHWKGCEVFQNMGCTGKTDIVIIHPELGPIQVDVKTASWCKNTEGNYWWCKSNASKVKPPVHAVVVIPDGDVSDWKVQWRKNHSPKGWENFWDNDHRTYRTTSTKPTNADETTR